MAMMEEIWKPIPNWEGLYEISTFGNVRSIDKKVGMRWRGKITTKFVKGRLLTPQYDKDGYKVIHLRDTFNGKNRLLKMHRLVAETFIPNPNGHPQIDHINGKRDDNRVDNLRWCTNKQNINFPIAMENRRNAVRESYNKIPYLRELRARTLGRCGLQPIIAYKDGVELGKFDSITDFCKEYGLVYNYLYNGIRKTGQYKGYSIKRLPKC